MTPGSGRSVIAISTAAGRWPASPHSTRSPASSGSCGGSAQATARRRSARLIARIEREEGAVAPDAGRLRALRRARFRQARNRPAAQARPRARGERATRGRRAVLGRATSRSGWSAPTITASPLSSVKRDAALLAFAFARHLDRPEGGRFDVDLELFDRRDQHMAAVGLAPQHGREQPDHRRPADRRAVVIPGAVAGDAHARMAAALRIPAVDRRQAALRRSAPADRRGSGPGARSVGGVSGIAAVIASCSAKRSSLRGTDCFVADAHAMTSTNRDRHRRRQAGRRGDRAGAARRRLDGRRPCPSRRRCGAGRRGEGGRGPCRCRLRASGFSPRPTGCRRCGCWSTMPRGSRGTDSASSSAGGIRRAYGGQCARADAADRRACAARMTAAEMRWSSTCSTPSWPRPIPIS